MNAYKQVFSPSTPESALTIISKTLCYEPENRLTALQCCADPFFDDIRDPDAKLPNGNPLPLLFNFTPDGMASCTCLCFSICISNIMESPGICLM